MSRKLAVFSPNLLQWDAVEPDIKVPSAENPGLKSPFLCLEEEVRIMLYVFGPLPGIFLLSDVHFLPS